MTGRIFARCIVPGFGPTETVTDYIDTLLDFAQFYEYPDFGLLARTIDTLEKEFKDTLCIDLPDEAKGFFQEAQDSIISYAYGRINREDVFLKRTSVLAKKLHEHPEELRNYLEAAAGRLVIDTFDTIFQEEVEDYYWHERIIAKIMWRFDNWFGDTITSLYSSLMSDMIEEVNYWKMARQVSVARAFG